MISFQDVHQCEQSKGKIVAIQKDLLGRTFCPYCNQQVDYSKILKQMEEEYEKSRYTKTTR